MAFNFDLVLHAELKNEGPSGASALSTRNTGGQRIETLLSVLTEASSVEYQDLGGGSETVMFSPSKGRGSIDRHGALKRALDRAQASQCARSIELNHMAKVAKSRNSDDVADVSFEPEPEPWEEESKQEDELVSSCSFPLSLLEANKPSKRKLPAALQDVLTTPPPRGSFPQLTSCPRPPAHQRKPSISSEETNVSSVDLVAAVGGPMLQKDTSSSTPKYGAATRKKQQELEYQCKPRYSSTWLTSTSLSRPEAAAKKWGELDATKSVNAGASVAAAKNKNKPSSSSKGAHLLGRLSSMSKLTPSLSGASLPKAARRLNKSLTSLADKNASIDVASSAFPSSENIPPRVNEGWDMVAPGNASSSFPAQQVSPVYQHHAGIKPSLKITQKTIKHMEQAVSVARQHGSINRQYSGVQESRKDAYISCSSPSEVPTLLLNGTHSSAPASFNLSKASSFARKDCFSSSGGANNPSLPRINKSMGSLGLTWRMKSAAGGGGTGGGNDAPRRCNATWDAAPPKLSRQNGSRSSFGSVRKSKKVSPGMLTCGEPASSSPSHNASWSI